MNSSHCPTRRQILAAGLAALIPKPVFAVPPVLDVVIIGAGAAGLAAARTVMKKHKVAVIEASHRIGGRAHTDTDTFGVPFDIGAHWLHHGKRNPYHNFAGENGYEIYPAPENYRLFAQDGVEVGSKGLNAMWKAHAKVVGAIGKSGKANKDVAASEAVAGLSGRWVNTAKLILGPWSMAKDFENFSTLDWWNSEDTGTDYFCGNGFGTLVAHYGAGIDVLLETKATRINWGGKNVVIETTRGTLESRAVILTVSTGVLAAGQIQFSPALDTEKYESFNAISMGSYDHIALLFAKDIFGMENDGYLLFEVSDDGRGFATLTNIAGTGLAYCDVGGNWARELERESEAFKIDYALGQLKSMLGNALEREFVKGATTVWGLNPLTRGSFASAKPGAYKMRKILRQSIGNKIFFAGEACHSTMWATVGGAHLSGVKTAKSVLKTLS